MLKRVLLILTLILVGCGSELDPPHEMIPLDPPAVDDGLPGMPLPTQYAEAYEITEEEWLMADMSYPEECISRKKNVRLILAGWEEFEPSCGGEAYSRHISEMHESHKSILGCTYFDASLGRQLITIDAGMSEARKLGTMMHEVIHALGSCATKDSDSDHSDSYRWDFILDKAKARVSCNSETLVGLVATRSEPYCILGKFPQ